MGSSGVAEEEQVAAAANGSCESLYGFESHEFHASAAQKEKMVQTIAESGAKQVPSRFLRAFPASSTGSGGDNPEAGSRGVPVIDLSGWTTGHDRDRVNDEVGKACEEWGFFQVSRVHLMNCRV